MTFFERYFSGHIFCINLERRTDRWAHAEAQFKKHGLTCVQRFEACVDPVPGRHDQNTGCTASHRALLDLCVANNWPSIFVFEDDFDILHEDFHHRFETYVKDVPADWDMLYIGGGYGGPPISRVSAHVIRAGRLMTTSSYGVTYDMAKRLAPWIVGSGPIDCLYADRAHDNKVYILSPRLVVQYPNHSDLQGKFMNNSASMLDSAHERSI